MATITVITYNVGGPINSFMECIGDLERLCREHKPAVIGLQEVGDRGEEILRAVRSTGYKPVIKKVGKRSHHVALLVNPKVKLDGTNIRNIYNLWEFVGFNVAGAKKHGRAEHKWIVYAKVRVDGKKWVVGTTHLIPSLTRDADARRVHLRQVKNCALWFRTRVRQPILMGDFNADPSTKMGRKNLAPLQRVARIWHVASMGGRHIDPVCTKHKARVKIEALEGYHSDHRPVKAIVTV